MYKESMGRPRIFAAILVILSLCLPASSQPLSAQVVGQHRPPAEVQPPDRQATTEIEYSAYFPLSAPGGTSGPSGDYGFGFACTNMGDETTDITFTYYDADGDVVWTQLQSEIDTGASAQVFLPREGQVVPVSAVATALEEIACGQNQQTMAGTRRVATSNAMKGSDIGPTLYVVQIVNKLGNFNSLVTIQNAGESETTVTATYYDASGQSVGTSKSVIPAKSARTFDQNDGTLPANFIGSAVFASSDENIPLAGTVTLYNMSSAQLLRYAPIASGSAKVYLPRLTKNLSGVGYTSGWSCQNLGPGPVDMLMSARFLNQETASTITATLASGIVGTNQSWSVYLGSSTGTALDAIHRGFGGATIEAVGGTIACIANEDNRSGGGGVASERAGQGSTYNGLNDGIQTRTVFFPQIVDLGSSGFQGGMQLYCLSEAGCSCTATYSNGDQFGISIPGDGAVSVFAPSSLVNNRGSFNGSASVTCTDLVVGIYNMSVSGAAASGDPFVTAEGTNR